MVTKEEKKMFLNPIIGGLFLTIKVFKGHWQLFSQTFIFK